MTTAPVEALGLINHDAERAVLVAMRDDMKAAVEMAEKLEPRDFYDTRRQVAFEALSNLLVRPDAIDTDAIVAECLAVAETRALKVRITADDINSLASEATNPLLQAHTVKRLAWLRRASDFAFWLVQEVQKRPEPDDLFAAAQEQWQHIAPPQDNTGIEYGWDAIPRHKQELRDRIAEFEAGTQVRFDWPWASWNYMVRPLRPGLMGIITAADGIGKTAYLEQIAEYWAQQGRQVAYVHLEDPLSYKRDRRLARHARVPIDNIEDGNLDQEMREKIRAAHNRMAEWMPNLHLVWSGGQSMQHILREVQSLVDQKLCDVIVFDYLDKVIPTREQARMFGSNVWEMQANSMEQLKVFAERNNVPVLTAAQGNKSMYQAGAGRASIQGSIQKSQKAQLVIVLSREIAPAGGQYDTDGELIAEEGQISPLITVHIDKQNRGRTGKFEQVMVGEFFSIGDPPSGRLP